MINIILVSAKTKTFVRLQNVPLHTQDFETNITTYKSGKTKQTELTISQLFLSQKCPKNPATLQLLDLATCYCIIISDMTEIVGLCNRKPHSFLVCKWHLRNSSFQRKSLRMCQLQVCTEIHTHYKLTF